MGLSLLWKRKWKLVKCNNGGWDVYINGEDVGWGENKKEAREVVKHHFNPRYVSKNTRAEMNRMSPSLFCGLWPIR